MKRIAITGATGLIGTALTRFLKEKGHQPVALVRGRDWDPQRGTVSSLDGFAAVVHLAGEPIAEKRWSPEQRDRILKSREVSTALLARTIAGMEHKPEVFVSASAVGYYGDGRDAWLDETSPSGQGFAAEVCRRWEAASQNAGVRTVNPRIGLVFSTAGGSLPELVRPFKLGAGGPLGSGRQYMSWISIDDTLAAIDMCIDNPTLVGPVNVVSPNPVTNKEIAQTLGRLLRRPSVLPAPAFALRALFGADKANELFLAGQRVKPSKLLAAGFRFRYPELEPALRHLLCE